MGSGTRLRVPITAGTTSCCPNLTPAGLGPSVPVGNAGLEPSSSSSSSPSSYPLLGPDLISPPAGRRLTQPRLPLHLQTLKGNGDFRLTFPTSPAPSRFPQAVVIKAAFNCPSAHLPTSPRTEKRTKRVWILRWLVRVGFVHSCRALESLLFSHPPIFTRLAGAVQELYPSAKRN